MHAILFLFFQFTVNIVDVKQRHGTLASNISVCNQNQYNNSSFLLTYSNDTKIVLASLYLHFIDVLRVEKMIIKSEINYQRHLNLSLMERLL